MKGFLMAEEPRCPHTFSPIVLLTDDLPSFAPIALSLISSPSTDGINSATRTILPFLLNN